MAIKGTLIQIAGITTTKTEGIIIIIPARVVAQTVPQILVAAQVQAVLQILAVLIIMPRLIHHQAQSRAIRIPELTTNRTDQIPNGFDLSFSPPVAR
jgi:NADH/NAD ratio-sensing transcriptional regulator Rex